MSWSDGYELSNRSTQISPHYIPVYPMAPWDF